MDIELYAGAKIKVGAFLRAVINFFIIAFCVFWLVKGLNAMQLQKILEPAPAEMTLQEKLLTEIRDLLKAKDTPAPPEASATVQSVGHVPSVPPT
jgi:large conductance mechanosensitive channel